jgi:hypothetical protein
MIHVIRIHTLFLQQLTDIYHKEHTHVPKNHTDPITGPNSPPAPPFFLKCNHDNPVGSQSLILKFVFTP